LKILRQNIRQRFPLNLSERGETPEIHVSASKKDIFTKKRQSMDDIKQEHDAQELFPVISQPSKKKIQNAMNRAIAFKI